DWSIENILTKGEGQTLDRASWKNLLNEMKRLGFRIVQTEWHHSRFKPQGTGAARSVITATLHAKKEGSSETLIIKGDLHVEWKMRASEEKKPRVNVIDAREMSVLRRRGAPAFEEAMAIDFGDNSTAEFVVLVSDLDQDGLCDVLLLGPNLFLRNRGEWRFDREKLLADPIPNLRAGVVGDFNCDGRLDLLVANHEQVALYVADENNKFSTPCKTVEALVGVQFPSVISAGDIDGDGDLDAWLGQYKLPYVGGQMPTPFYDANDGYPSFLLLNDGKGSFVDATERSGLGGKRRRRVYSASFVDVDGDRDLDLITANDFAGIDIFANDGRGRFSDVTEALVDDRHCFGMSLTFGDYDLDGKFDIFITGMGSTTARRLDDLGLNREGFAMHAKMRQRMAYGNRMYLDRGATFRQPDFKDQVARTGWSWGT
ncbi:MAG: VCBS repeat-containing protein, partial [Planctomycetes bacterium]|nr:VCBS repeat-containing protein [Planctomycetota bacterium]